MEEGAVQVGTESEPFEGGARWCSRIDLHMPEPAVEIPALLSPGTLKVFARWHGKFGRHIVAESAVRVVARGTVVKPRCGDGRTYTGVGEIERHAGQRLPSRGPGARGSVGVVCVSLDHLRVVVVARVVGGFVTPEFDALRWGGRGVEWKSFGMRISAHWRRRRHRNDQLVWGGLSEVSLQQRMRLRLWLERCTGLGESDWVGATGRDQFVGSHLSEDLLRLLQRGW